MAGNLALFGMNQTPLHALSYFKKIKIKDKKHVLVYLLVISPITKYFAMYELRKIQILV